MRIYMKKATALLFTLMIAFTLTGCGDACKDNVLTGLGDTFATIGKDGLEKEKVLAERKASRAAACAEQKAGEMKKKMGL